MKNILRRLWVIVLGLCIIIGCIPLKIEAATPSGTMFNPIKLGTGGKYTKTWTSYNDDLDFYVSFKMKKRGYVTINASKPFDDEGEIVSYQLYIYDNYGELVWNCSTKGQSTIPTRNYTYKVGLKKGSYTLRLEPSFTVVSGKISSKVSIKTTANSYWEVENNDSVETATVLKLNKKYTGVYCDNQSFGEDYLKFKLTGGKKYRIKLGNGNKLFSSNTTIVRLYGPNGKELKEYGKNTKHACYTLKDFGAVTIKADKTGYYCLKLTNSQGKRNPGYQYTIIVKPQ